MTSASADALGVDGAVQIAGTRGSSPISFAPLPSAICAFLLPFLKLLLFLKFKTLELLLLFILLLQKLLLLLILLKMLLLLILRITASTVKIADTAVAALDIGNTAAPLEMAGALRIA